MEGLLLKIVEQLSEVRLYSACGVLKGVMVRDNEKVFHLVKEARILLEKIKNTEESELKTQHEGKK
jgi:hypothetical protein